MNYINNFFGYVFGVNIYPIEISASTDLSGIILFLFICPLIVFVVTKARFSTVLLISSPISSVIVVLNILFIRGHLDYIGEKPFGDELVYVTNCSDICGVEDYLLLVGLIAIFIISLFVRLIHKEL